VILRNIVLIWVVHERSDENVIPKYLKLESWEIGLLEIICGIQRDDRSRSFDPLLSEKHTSIHLAGFRLRDLLCDQELM
jgi:hypothetical protein